MFWNSSLSATLFFFQWKQLSDQGKALTNTGTALLFGKDKGLYPGKTDKPKATSKIIT